MIDIDSSTKEYQWNPILNIGLIKSEDNAADSI